MSSSGMTWRRASAARFQPLLRFVRGSSAARSRPRCSFCLNAAARQVPGPALAALPLIVHCGSLGGSAATEANGDAAAALSRQAVDETGRLPQRRAGCGNWCSFPRDRVDLVPIDT
jgi:hypothetical protein